MSASDGSSTKLANLKKDKSHQVGSKIRCDKTV